MKQINQLLIVQVLRHLERQEVQARIQLLYLLMLLQWYYITKVGQLFKWTGKNNAFAMASRGVAQFLNGKFEAWYWRKTFFIVPP